MLVCAIDGRSRLLNLVLTHHGEDGIPRPLDCRRFSRKAAAADIGIVFEEWESFGVGGVALIVCNSADALTSELLEKLHALARVEWVEQPDLDEVLCAWEETIPPRQWLRGTMMALLASVPRPSHRDWWWGGVGDYWLEAWFSSHLAELEQYRAARQPTADSGQPWLEDVPF